MELTRKAIDDLLREIYEDGGGPDCIEVDTRAWNNYFHIWHRAFACRVVGHNTGDFYWIDGARFCVRCWKIVE